MAEAMLSDMTDEEVEALLEQHHVPSDARVKMRQEVALSRALRSECYAVIDRIKAGETIQHDELSRRMAEIAESMGFDMGIPMPDLEHGHQFVTARNTPLGFSLQHMTGRTEHASELEQAGLRVNNSWDRIGDESVSIVEGPDGMVGFLTDHHAGRRLRKMVGGQIMRAMLPHLTADAELKAMDCLKNKLQPSQFDSYVLTGMFPELSKKSDIHYIFRKGLPTLALSYHHSKGGRVIAALCLHPFGYYAGTHVGAMTPTDEVIAHLLTMRGDEHKFWARSGQWSAIDPRSGI